MPVNSGQDKGRPPQQGEAGLFMFFTRSEVRSGLVLVALFDVDELGDGHMAVEEILERDALQVLVNHVG